MEQNTTHYSVKKIKHRVDVVAKRIGHDRASLTLLLRNAGYKLGKCEAFLSEEMMEALADRYVKVVEASFNSYIQKKHKYGHADAYEENFYAQFAPGKNLRYFHDLVDLEFDKELIKKAFYRLISTVTPRRDYGSKLHQSVLHQFKSQAGVYLRSTSSILSSIIAPGLFFNYTDDEDSAQLATEKGFAVAGN